MKRPPLRLITPLWFEARRDAARYELLRQKRVCLLILLPLAIATLTFLLFTIL